MDLKSPHAVLAACIDLSKAFNRVDHLIIIEDLYNMNTPSWLLKIIISYLSNRSMQLTYRGEVSSLKQLPAGCPQGAYLGVLIFIIKFNGAFLRPSIPRPLALKEVSSIAVKYIDDGSVAVSVDLSQTLIPDPVCRPRPLAYNERTCHVLPQEKNLLQYFVRDAEKFAAKNNMIINKKKTQALLFSTSRKFAFPPEIEFEDGTNLEMISETKLLGVIISNDLKWHKNTSYLCVKARRKLWILKKLLLLDLSVMELYDVYTKEVRSILEYAVPVWHSGITKRQSNQIESVQKLAFRIMLKGSYTSYSAACAFFGTESLERRRQAMCLKFTMKNLNSSNSLFAPYVQHPGLRRRIATGRKSTSVTPYAFKGAVSHFWHL